MTVEDSVKPVKRTSEEQYCDSEEFDENFHSQSVDLPDDFIPDNFEVRRDGSNSSYEHSNPIEHFTSKQ